ncbi:Peroxiredoxin [Caldisphaera lagunensis DSM 15908]|uniref:thioredoxin-dependent peroxiredoxin n=1 Tax=Caldisphaera lagunensis (strain DSM 15908 / JCM 11604 / ANMR 0165 / IC-154) TaxID=1056495 RepID=L0A7W3_CALLD|nr:peroxiredoxin [Caldisphaera lagunensis]AFZ69963.1 Peroxiredoxin [Caldisphaera lagunensis DSM 15908]
MVKVGDKAPVFEGIDDSGNKFSLKDFLGKYNIVVYFYPKDDTPGCTKEACSFRDNWDLLKNLDTIVIGVSSDDIDSHKNFKKKYSLPFILISDKDKKIRKLYGADSFLIPSRITYLINKEGIITLIYKNQLNPQSHVIEVLNKLKGT